MPLETVKLKILIVGIGNEWRGDDAAGLLAVRRISRERLPTATFLEHKGDATELMENWQQAEMVFLIDAVQSGAPAGTIHRLDAVNEQIHLSKPDCSSHGLGLAEAVELARAMGKLPPILLIYGIEAGTFATGNAISREVNAAVEQVAKQILSELKSLPQSI